MSRSGPRLRVGIAGVIGFCTMQPVYLALFIIFAYLAVAVFWTSIRHSPSFYGGH